MGWKKSCKSKGDFVFELDFIGFPHLARIQMQFGKDSGHFGVYVSVPRLKKGVEKKSWKP